LSGCLLALLFPEPVLMAAGLAVITITVTTGVYVKARYHPSKWKTQKPGKPDSRVAITAALGLPLLGLLSAFLLTNHRITDPVEIAEVFSHCLFWGIFAGLITSVVIQIAIISRARRGTWDRELDGPVDGG
jgi:hypothetical protein